MKRLTLSLALLISMACFSTQFLDAQVLLGDVNADGLVTIEDAGALVNYIVGITYSINHLAADLDDDGKREMDDALFIAQFLAGIISEIPSTTTPTPQPSGMNTPDPTPNYTTEPDCIACAEVTIYGYVSINSEPVEGAQISLASGDIIATNAEGYYSFTTTGSCEHPPLTFEVDSVNLGHLSTRTVEIPGCGSVQADLIDPLSPDSPLYHTAAVWFATYEQTVVRSKTFTTQILVNSGSEKICAYLFDIEYNPLKLSLATGDGQGLVADVDGFVTAVNAKNKGVVKVAGIDPYGKGPAPALRFLTASWKAEATGLTRIKIANADSVTEQRYIRESYYKYASYIRVIDYGDVDASGRVDIVDALQVARYYIGLAPANFFADAADVNGSGSADIVDALMIAQYYVGMRTGFPVEEAN